MQRKSARRATSGGVTHDSGLAAFGGEVRFRVWRAMEAAGGARARGGGAWVRGAHRGRKRRMRCGEVEGEGSYSVR